MLAGFFLGAYIGLSAPVIALGVATEYVTGADVMLVFVVLAAIAIAAGARASCAARLLDAGQTGTYPPRTPRAGLLAGPVGRGRFSPQLAETAADAP